MSGPGKGLDCGFKHGQVLENWVGLRVVYEEIVPLTADGNMIVVGVCVSSFVIRARHDIVLHDLFSCCVGVVDAFVTVPNSFFCKVKKR